MNINTNLINDIIYPIKQWNIRKIQKGTILDHQKGGNIALMTQDEAGGGCEKWKGYQFWSP